MMIPVNYFSCSDVVAVVPAAGIGVRMLAACPKQYLSISGKTILEHSVAALLAHRLISRIIIALNPHDTHFHLLPIARDPRISVVKGGEQRTDSVLSGLKAAAGAKWVLVHDAARPCLHISDLTRLLDLIRNSKVGGILAAPVRDTMKRAVGQGNTIDHTVEREALWHALTPQLFPLSLLRECLFQSRNRGMIITDEASALEYCGYHPQLVMGRRDNLKVTRPEDLAFVQFYLSQMYN